MIILIQLLSIQKIEKILLNQVLLNIRKYEKIVIIGSFAIGSNDLGCQTVKTNEIYNELLRIYGKGQILILDTSKRLVLSGMESMKIIFRSKFKKIYQV